MDVRLKAGWILVRLIPPDEQIGLILIPKICQERREVGIVEVVGNGVTVVQPGDGVLLRMAEIDLSPNRWVAPEKGQVLVREHEIYALMDENGQITPLGQWVLIEPTAVPETFYDSKVVIPEYYKDGANARRSAGLSGAVLAAGPDCLQVAPADIVYYDDFILNPSESRGGVVVIDGAPLLFLDERTIFMKEVRDE